MATTIVWTDEALRCLENIHDYIKADRPVAADRVAAGIYKKVQILRTSPRLGWRFVSIKDREVRIILYGNYRIAYWIRSETHIDIIGIFHAAMDIDRYLF